MPIKVDDSGTPYMDPGRLKHQITFLDQVIGSDVSGTSLTYAAADPPETAAAEIRPMRGTDKIKAGQEVSQVLIIVTIRYRATATANRRIQAPGGSVYVIQAVENIGLQNTWMELTCMGIGSND